MTLLRAAAQRRAASLEDPAVTITGTTLADWATVGAGVDSGVVVTERSALKASAVWRAVALISGLSGALPLGAYDRVTLEPVQRSVLTDPHNEMTGLELWRLLAVHRLLWGNSYALKLRQGFGPITRLEPLMPWHVKVERVPAGRGREAFKRFWVSTADGVVPLLSSEVLHIPGMGYDGVTGCSVIRHAAAQAVGLAQAAEMFGAKFFGNGVMMAGVLQTEQRLDADQAAQLKANWRAKMQGIANAHEIAVLDSGATWAPVSMSSVDAQFLETRKFQTTEVARFFGVPPFLLMDTEKSTSWGTGLEQQALGFVNFDLHPTWLAPVEARLTKEVLLTPSVVARYDLDGLSRGDSAARSGFYSAMRAAGVFSANDIRRREKLPPIEGGDTYLSPLNMAPADAAAPDAADSEDGNDDATV